MTAPVDTLVIGAGPAGLQLAYALGKSDVGYLVLEAGSAPGRFFDAFPRHRTLISINKRNVGRDPGNPLRYDWNSLLGEGSPRFTEYSERYFPAATDMVRYLADYAVHHNLSIHYGKRCVSIDHASGPSGEQFQIATHDGTVYTAKRVVVATGLSQPRLPVIPGIEHAERYVDFATDPERFRDARVLIIGKGNSAFETANSLIETAATIHICSPTPVRFAWASHFVGNLRAVNNNFLDTYQLKSQNAVLDAEISRIQTAGAGYIVDLAYTHAAGHRVSYRYDRIIACTGFRFDDSFFEPGLRPQLCHDDRLPAMNSNYESVNVPGVYFAGTLMQSRDFKKTMSSFIHGFRYNIQFLAALLTDGDHLAFNSRIAAKPDTLAEHSLRRLNNSDALFLQPGYLADVFTYDPLSPGDNSLAYYPGIPVDYLRDGHLGAGPHFTLTLEYGPPAPNPFQIERVHHPSYADVTPFLHPVLRRIEHGVEISRHNFLEDLENSFSPEEYLAQLQKFFRDELEAVTPVSPEFASQKRL